MIIYATAQFPNGCWQHIAIFNNPCLAAHVMIKHSQGRPWVMTADQGTIEKIVNSNPHRPKQTSHKTGCCSSGRSGFPSETQIQLQPTP